jgi:HEAT repeat protein
LGPAAVTPAIFDHLPVLLGDVIWNVRAAAANAIGALGPAAVTPLILDRLATWIQDTDWVMRAAAAGAIGALGPAAATPLILDRLATWIQDTTTNVREAAAEAVGALDQHGVRIFYRSGRYTGARVKELAALEVPQPKAKRAQRRKRKALSE